MWRLTMRAVPTRSQSIWWAPTATATSSSPGARRRHRTLGPGSSDSARRWPRPAYPYRIILRGLALPRAIVAGNDQMALALVADLAAVGIAVPREVAVTGFDDIQLARLVSPPLTTVHQPMRELGARCVTLLLDRLSGDEGPPRAVVVPTALVVRESCGCRAPRPTRVPIPGRQQS